MLFFITVETRQTARQMVAVELDSLDPSYDDLLKAALPNLVKTGWVRADARMYVVEAKDKRGMFHA